MPKYLVFWKDLFIDALDDDSLNINADDVDYLEYLDIRCYSAENRTIAATMFSSDEYEDSKKTNDMFCIYRPTMIFIASLVDYNEFVEGVSISEKKQETLCRSARQITKNTRRKQRTYRQQRIRGNRRIL